MEHEIENGDSLQILPGKPGYAIASIIHLPSQCTYTIFALNP